MYTVFMVLISLVNKFFWIRTLICLCFTFFLIFVSLFFLYLKKNLHIWKLNIKDESCSVQAHSQSHIDEITTPIPRDYHVHFHTSCMLQTNFLSWVSLSSKTTKTYTPIAEYPHLVLGQYLYTVVLKMHKIMAKNVNVISKKKIEFHKKRLKKMYDF